MDEHSTVVTGTGRGFGRAMVLGLIKAGHAVIGIERGHVFATFLSGFETRKVFDVYRDTYQQTWSRPAPADRLAYMALCTVADTREEALKRAYKVAGYLRTIGAVSEPFRNPPGYLSVADNVRALANFGKPRLGLQLSDGGRSMQRLRRAKTV